MSNPPAGWYPDPGNAQQQRWWDNVQWGPQTRPLFQAPPPPPGMAYAAGTHYPLTTEPVTGGTTTRLRKTNGIGFAGAVLGLASFVWDPFLLTSITAMVLCIVGLVRDERRRKEGAQVAGRGWMIAGLILGCVSTVLFAAIWVQDVARIFNQH